MVNMKQYAKFYVALSTSFFIPPILPHLSQGLEINVYQAPLLSKFFFRFISEKFWVIFGRQKRMKWYLCPDNNKLREGLWQMSSCSYTRNFLIYFSDSSSLVLQVAESNCEVALQLSYYLNFRTLEEFFIVSIF